MPSYADLYAAYLARARYEAEQQEIQRLKREYFERQERIRAANRLARAMRQFRYPEYEIYIVRQNHEDQEMEVDQENRVPKMEHKEQAARNGEESFANVETEPKVPNAQPEVEKPAKPASSEVQAAPEAPKTVRIPIVDLSEADKPKARLKAPESDTESQTSSLSMLDRLRQQSEALIVPADEAAPASKEKGKEEQEWVHMEKQ